MVIEFLATVFKASFITSNTPSGLQCVVQPVVEKVQAFPNHISAFFSMSWSDFGKSTPENDGCRLILVN